MKVRRHNNCRVEVVDLRDGTTYPTIESAARGLYLSRWVLTEARSENRNSVCGIPIEFIETDIPINSKTVQCVETGQTYVSALVAAEAIGRSRHTLRSAIADGCKCAGYHWRYLPSGT